MVLGVESRNKRSYAQTPVSVSRLNSNHENISASCQQEVSDKAQGSDEEHVSP